MLQKIIAFFMSIIAFFMQLFGLGGNTIKSYTDVSYGSDQSQCVDIYFPKDTSEPVGLVVFIHGGAWVGGDKGAYTESCRYTANDLGLAAVTLNYRMLGTEGIDCEDMLDDITAALLKVKEYAEKDGVTFTKAALGGDSAGGHLSLLYSYRCASVSPVEIGFCFSNSGPTDLTDPAFYENNSMGDDFVWLLASRLSGANVTKDTLNDPDVVAALQVVSPVTYVTSESVPTLMAHGQKDGTVPFSNAVTLDNALTAAGVPHDFYVYPNSDHDLSGDPDVSSAYSAKLLEYAAQYLK